MKDATLYYHWRSLPIRNFSWSLLAFCLLAFAVPADGQSSNEIFDDANRAYAEGNFRKAATNWNLLLAKGQTSAAVYFNLGNAWFKAGQLGQAIAAYRKAQALSPRDPDVQANLKFARNRVQGLTLPEPRWRRIFGKLSVDEWTLVTAAAAWTWLLILAASQLRPAWRPILKSYGIAFGCMCLLFCGCLSFVYYHSRVPSAIVTTSQAPVRQAPLAESEISFSLHDGAEVLVLDRKDNWLQVTPNGSRTGWVLDTQVAAIKGS